MAPTAACRRRVSSLTQFVRQQRLALDGVSALTDLPAAVAQIEADFPWNAVVRVSDLQERAVSYRPLLLRQKKKRDKVKG